MYVRETGLSKAKRFELLVATSYRARGVLCSEARVHVGTRTVTGVSSGWPALLLLSKQVTLLQISCCYRVEQVIPPANLGQGSMLKLHVQHVLNSPSTFSFRGTQGNTMCSSLSQTQTKFHRILITTGVHSPTTKHSKFNVCTTSIEKHYIFFYHLNFFYHRKTL